MRNEVSVGGITAKPGTIAKGLWKISELYDGSSVEIPVAVINGSEDGAILWAQSSVHGDEYVGTHAIQRLLLQVDPKEMKGAIIAIPWLNVLAYRWGTRGAPQDGMDMNRIWPGKPLDTAMHIFAHSELVVHEVFSEMRRLADVVMDLHDGSVWQVESAYFGGQNVHRLTAAPEVESSYPSGLGRRVEGLPLRAHPVRFSRCV